MSGDESLPGAASEEAASSRAVAYARTDQAASLNGSTRVLLVDDNEDDVFLTRRAFSTTAPGISLDSAGSGQEALESIGGDHFDLVILDYKLPDMDGLDLLARLTGVGVPVIMVTGRGDERLAVQALKMGAEDYLVKEEGYLRRLPQAVTGAITRSRLDKENRRLVAQTSRQAGLLQAVLETDPGAVAVLRGPEMRIELANASMRAIIPGFDEAAPIGRPLHEAFPGFLGEEWTRLLDSVYETGTARHLEEVGLPSGSRGRRYFNIHLLPMEDAQDERGVTVTMWEVTEQVESRQSVEKLARETETQRAWLQAVIDQMPGGVHIASAPDATLLFSNQIAQELLGPPPTTDLSQASVPQVFSLRYPDGSNVPVEELPLQRALWRGESVRGMELRHLRPDGVAIDIWVNSAPLYDTEGKVIAGVAVFQDITQIKNIERVKDEFISIASHELRTPLTSVRATAQLMLKRKRDYQLSPQDLNSLNAIVQQSSRMARLIEELLDVSRLQTGKIQVKLRRLDLASLAAEVVEEQRLSNQDFTFHLVAADPVWVDADRDRTAQVISNLLDNAVKYSPAAKEATVRVSIDEDRGVAILEVSDRGSGFEQSYSEVIFERFSRLGSVVHHSRGMGLGLYICREIMKAHGGTITAYSAGSGQGATFTVEMPLSSS